MKDLLADNIHAIHEELAKIQDDGISINHYTPFDVHGSPLTDYSPIKEEDVEKLIRQAAPKSCCLGLVPTKIVKECLNLLVPFITRMINQSFSSWSVPKAFKLVPVISLLKKTNLTPESVKNFSTGSCYPSTQKGQSHSRNSREHSIHIKFKSPFTFQGHGKSGHQTIMLLQGSK